MTTIDRSGDLMDIELTCAATAVFMNVSAGLRLCCDPRGAVAALPVMPNLRERLTPCMSEYGRNFSCTK